MELATDRAQGALLYSRPIIVRWLDTDRHDQQRARCRAYLLFSLRATITRAGRHQVTISVEDIVVIGVDPGPRPGIVGLRYSPQRVRTAAPAIIQCTLNVAIACIQAIIPADVKRIYLSYEPFVMGARSAKVSTPAASAATARFCGALQTLAYGDNRIVLRHHQASAVKPWGMEERLERAGLHMLVKGMTHARDGAKQALYCATHDAGVPDPLSKRHKLAEVAP
jgi:hypothetical protein